MKLRYEWNRRTFLGGMSALAGAFFTRKMSGLSQPGKSSLTGFGQSSNVYEELGVTTVINGEGTMTMLGGSLMRPEVEAVMANASHHFVHMPELEVAAGKRIAELLKLPEGYTTLVTSGAASAIQNGLCGVLTGDNEDFIRQLPDVTGMKSEVIIQKSHRNPFDHQLRATGVKLVEVETREDVLRAVSPRTAMMHFSNFANDNGRIKVDEWAKLAKEHQIPCFNDAAADVPPVSHLWDYTRMGYDLVAFSGGKAMRGPQCAGILIGRKDLVSYALLNMCPHEDTLGRSQKIGKEEIVGMVKAVELYLAEDQEPLIREWWARLDRISTQITKVPGVTTSFHVPGIANHVPHMNINWDPRRINLTSRQVSEALRSSKPAIVLGRSEEGLSMCSFMLQPGEDKIIAERLTQIFQGHSA
ncbi:MAG TPA: aminotransferase class V-fold PLP-dependent enzyme [Candidatus Angelobacter sp.]|nr:aminotransferase class V-fold PLP-dependent enzyme [Candidatus Angelobacter sp.]